MAVSEELMNLFVQNGCASESSLLESRNSFWLTELGHLVVGILADSLAYYTLKQERSGDAGSPQPEQEPWQGSVPDMRTCGHQKCLKKSFASQLLVWLP